MLRQHLPFKDPKPFAVAFASVVTSPSSKHKWIAKNGGDSIFVLLKTILPEVDTYTTETMILLTVIFW